MKLIVRTWLTACVALVTVTAAQMTLAQSVISDNDVARLRAFICLLYTSPSPRDATLSRMPSSA